MSSWWLYELTIQEYTKNAFSENSGMVGIIVAEIKLHYGKMLSCFTIVPTLFSFDLYASVQATNMEKNHKK